MKTKKERAKLIKDLLDKVRKDIEIKSEMSLLRLENLEKMEDRAIEENTDAAVDRIKKIVREQKRRVYKLKSIGKKFIVENGKIIKVEQLI